MAAARERLRRAALPARSSPSPLPAWFFCLLFLECSLLALLWGTYIFVARVVTLPVTRISGIKRGYEFIRGPARHCPVTQQCSVSPIGTFSWCHRGVPGSRCKGIAHLHNLISGMVEKPPLETAELIDWSDNDTDMSGISAAFLHH